MARKTGIYYAGVDDFTMIYPKYSTDYNLYYRTNDMEYLRKGCFEDIDVVIVAYNPQSLLEEFYEPLNNT